MWIVRNEGMEKAVMWMVKAVMRAVGMVKAVM